jgi:hypothetical protein
MSQTSCERRSFPVPLRWPYAGGDPSRNDHGDYCAECPLTHSSRPPKCQFQTPELACVRICTSRRASVISAIEAGALVKSP